MDFPSLLTNPIVVLVGIIGGVCSIVAIPLSFWLYIKSKHNKHPRYMLISQNIIRGLATSIPELKITYTGFGQPLSNFTVTRLCFWNAGRETINRQDVAKNDPLRINIKEPFQVLDATILHATSKANNVDVALDRERKHIALNFDYLDFGDGAIIQIINNGVSGKDFCLTGSVKGYGVPERIFPSGKSQHHRLSYYLSDILFIMASLMFFVLGSYFKSQLGQPDIVQMLGFVIALATGLALGIWTGSRKAKRAFRLLPKGLRGFVDQSFVPQ